MNKPAFVLLVLTLMHSSNAMATITCSEPKLSKPVAHNSIYNFKAVVTCELVGEKIDLKTLNSAYLNDITKKGSQFKVYNQHDYDDHQGMTGYAVEASQAYVTPNGAMNVRADIVIANNGTDKFHYSYKSKRITAEDDAKFDKTILNTTDLQIQPDKSQLTVIKVIDVEEPWYAPDSVFFGKVEPELKDSTRKAAMLHARKISGQDVDPLKK
jgi:hypothetical protein